MQTISISAGESFDVLFTAPDHSGGTGPDIYLLYNHMKPRSSPLGPGNVCCISAGILGGTPASASARTHIMAKSPLTGFLGSSNMGGFFAPELRYAGFDHLDFQQLEQRDHDRPGSGEDG